MGGIFSKDKKNKPNTAVQLGADGPAEAETDVATASDEDLALSSMIDVYLGNRLIDIPLVPASVERHIYAGVLRIVFDGIASTGRGVQVLGHRLDIRITPMLTDSACRMARLAAGPEAQQRSALVVDQMVERLIENQAVDIFMLPDWVERRLYANILRLVLGVVQDTLLSTSLDVMGHRMSIAFGALDGLPPVPAVATPAPAVDDKDATDPVVQAVNTYMQAHNVFLLPDFIERHLYVTSMRLLLAIAKECVSTARLRVLDHVVNFDIQEAVPPPSSKKEEKQ